MRYASPFTLEVTSNWAVRGIVTGVGSAAMAAGDMRAPASANEPASVAICILPPRYNQELIRRIPMKIALLAGDGIGPEILAEAKKVLDVFRGEGVKIETEEALVGGAAYDAHKHPLP